MNHRHRKCNYSAFTHLFDRLFGSFRPYRPLDFVEKVPVKEKWYRAHLGVSSQDEEEEEEEDHDKGRVKLMPSPWSVVALGVGLVFFAVADESWQRGQLVKVTELTAFFRIFVILANYTVVCLAGGVTPEKKKKLPKRYYKERPEDEERQYKAFVQQEKQRKVPVPRKNVYKVKTDKYEENDAITEAAEDQRLRNRRDPTFNFDDLQTKVD